MASAAGIKAGEAYVEVKAFLDPLAQGLGKAEGMLRSFAGTVGRVGGALANLRTAFAATALVAGLKQAVSGMDDLYNSALQLGTTPEALSGLRYAFAQVGLDADSANRALFQFEAAIARAAEGSEQMQLAFLKLGLSAGELSKMPIDQAFLKAAAAAQKLGNQYMLTQEARELFGRSARQVVGAVRAGDLGATTAQGKAAGAVVSNEEATATHQFMIELRNVGVAIAGVARAVLADLLPGLMGLAKAFQAALQDARQWVLANQNAVTAMVAGSVAALGLGAGLKIVSVTVIPLVAGVLSLGAAVLANTGAFLGWAASINFTRMAVTAYNATLAVLRSITITLPAAYYAMATAQKLVTSTLFVYTAAIPPAVLALGAFRTVVVALPGGLYAVVTSIGGFIVSVRVLSATLVTVSTGVRALAFSTRAWMLGMAVFGQVVIPGVVAGLTAMATALSASLSGGLLAYAALAGAAVVIGMLGYKALTASDALDTLGKGFKEIGKVAVDAWQGISDAVKAGDLGLAMKIAWNGIKMAWYEGIASLRDAWGDLQHWWGDSLDEMAGGFQTLFGRSAREVVETIEASKKLRRLEAERDRAARRAQLDEELKDLKRAQAELRSFAFNKANAKNAPEFPGAGGLGDVLQKFEVVGSFNAAAIELAGSKQGMPELIKIQTDQLAELGAIKDAVQGAFNFR